MTIYDRSTVVACFLTTNSILISGMCNLWMSSQAWHDIWRVDFTLIERTYACPITQAAVEKALDEQFTL